LKFCASSYYGTQLQPGMGQTDKDGRTDRQNAMPIFLFTGRDTITRGRELSIFIQSCLSPIDS